MPSCVRGITHRRGAHEGKDQCQSWPDHNNSESIGHNESRVLKTLARLLLRPCGASHEAAVASLASRALSLNSSARFTRKVSAMAFLLTPFAQKMSEVLMINGQSRAKAMTLQHSPPLTCAHRARWPSLHARPPCDGWPTVLRITDQHVNPRVRLRVLNPCGTHEQAAFFRLARTGHYLMYGRVPRHHHMLLGPCHRPCLDIDIHRRCC